MIAACRDLPVAFRLLARGGYAPVALAQHHRLAEIQLARDVLDADVVINLPKAKTHSQTLYTGAVKNMFGAVAPRQRLDIHLLGRYWALSEAIADCYSARAPHLHLMDAVVGMEGMGPTQGTPVEIGFLAASTDGVALDALTQDLLGFRPDQVATTVAGASLGLGEADLHRIAVTGADPARLRCRIRQAAVSWGGMPAPLIRALGALVKARPKVHRELCRACGACAGICPREAITVGRHAVINYERCVECFCCLEACPYDAIGVKRSALYQAVWAIKRRMDRRATSRR
jgi:ferredoxin